MIRDNIWDVKSGDSVSKVMQVIMSVSAALNKTPIRLSSGDVFPTAGILEEAGGISGGDSDPGLTILELEAIWRSWNNLIVQNASAHTGVLTVQHTGERGFTVLHHLYTELLRVEARLEAIRHIEDVDFEDRGGGGGGGILPQFPWLSAPAGVDVMTYSAIECRVSLRKVSEQLMCCGGGGWDERCARHVSALRGRMGVLLECGPWTPDVMDDPNLRWRIPAQSGVQSRARAKWCVSQSFLVVTSMYDWDIRVWEDADALLSAGAQSEYASGVHPHVLAGRFWAPKCRPIMETIKYKVRADVLLADKSASAKSPDPPTPAFTTTAQTDPYEIDDVEMADATGTPSSVGSDNEEDLDTCWLERIADRIHTCCVIASCGRKAADATILSEAHIRGDPNQPRVRPKKRAYIPGMSRIQQELDESAAKRKVDIRENSYYAKVALTYAVESLPYGSMRYARYVSPIQHHDPAHVLQREHGKDFQPSISIFVAECTGLIDMLGRRTQLSGPSSMGWWYASVRFWFQLCSEKLPVGADGIETVSRLLARYVIRVGDVRVHIDRLRKTPVPLFVQVPGSLQVWWKGRLWRTLDPWATIGLWWAIMRNATTLGKTTETDQDMTLAQGIRMAHVFDFVTGGEPIFAGMRWR